MVEKSRHRPWSRHGGGRAVSAAGPRAGGPGLSGRPARSLGSREAGWRLPAAAGALLDVWVCCLWPRPSDKGSWGREGTSVLKSLDPEVAPVSAPHLPGARARCHVACGELRGHAWIPGGRASRRVRHHGGQVGTRSWLSGSPWEWYCPTHPTRRLAHGKWPRRLGPSPSSRIWSEPLSTVWG